MAAEWADGPDVVAAMVATDMLGAASGRGLVALARTGHVRRIPRGGRLFAQGDHAADIYLLLEGRIEISSVTADGRRQLHTSILPPQLFGELGPLADDVRTAAATAVSASFVWSTDIARFEEFLATEPAAGRALLASLARQVIATGALVDDLRGLDLTGRLAKRLLSLVTPSFDRLPANGAAIPAVVTQADLASLANGSREQVTRILADLQRTGLVSRQGRRVVLTDVAGLARLAGLA
jgi:CRP-like cAMP-binding protein